MKVLLHYPEWGNRWIPYVEQSLNCFDLMVFNRPTNGKFDIDILRKLSAEADVLVSMWCDGVTALWTREFPEKKIVSYLRRYELWEESLHRSIEWPAIDELIFVSEYCRVAFKNVIQGTPQHTVVIPNGVDLTDFPLRKGTASVKNIAMVCTIKNVKNIPLAAQILLKLPEDYKIHHIGIPFSSQIVGQIFSYIKNLGLSDRFISNGWIDRSEVNGWLMDKGVILSTSINEGNPNNIIEAMAMGIKPAIHNWPGSKEQFPNHLIFNTPEEAVNIITSEYRPREYRDHVVSRFSVDNFKQLTRVIENVYRT